MSVAYAVDFASLLLIGPHKAMVVAAISAYGLIHEVHRSALSPAPGVPARPS